MEIKKKNPTHVSTWTNFLRASIIAIFSVSEYDRHRESQIGKIINIKNVVFNNCYLS